MADCFLAMHGEKKYHFLYNRNALLKIQIMAVELGEVLNSSRGWGGGEGGGGGGGGGTEK